MVDRKKGNQITDDIQWIGIQPWQMRRGEIDFSERVGIGHNILKINRPFFIGGSEGSKDERGCAYWSRDVERMRKKALC